MTHHKWVGFLFTIPKYDVGLTTSWFIIIKCHFTCRTMGCLQFLHNWLVALLLTATYLAGNEGMIHNNYQ